MSDLVVARTSGIVMLNGRRHPLRKGMTVAREGHPIVAANPRLWEPLRVHYDVAPDEVAAAAIVDAGITADDALAIVGGTAEDEAAGEDAAHAEDPAGDEQATAEEADVTAESPAAAPVEQATAAPGERRNVRPPVKRAAKKAAPPATDADGTDK